MKKTRWGLIGCGKVVLKNTTTPFLNKKNTIVGICTTDIKHSKLAKEKLSLKNCGCYNDIIKMIENEKIDALYICTTPNYHYYYMKKIASYKIPVYVEKPFVLTTKEAKEINELYKLNNTLLFVAHYKRLTKKFQKLKKLIKQNKIGKIIEVNGNFERKFQQNLLSDSWIYNKQISGGGRFFDISPHIFDIIYYLFGDFSKINSFVIYEREKHKCENLINFGCLLNGKIACKLDFNFISEKEDDIIQIKGENGKIITSINRDMPIFIYNKKNKLVKKYQFKKIRTWGIEAVCEINKLLKDNKRKTDICTGDDAYKIQKYIELTLKS